MFMDLTQTVTEEQRPGWLIFVASTAFLFHVAMIIVRCLYITSVIEKHLTIYGRSQKKGNVVYRNTIASFCSTVRSSPVV